MVMARFIRNDRLIDALMAQALSALGALEVPRSFRTVHPIGWMSGKVN